MQTFGCEWRGSIDPFFAPITLTGSGRVLAAVTVSEHPDKTLPTPLAIGTVEVDEGTTVRTQLDMDCVAGDRVFARDVDGALVLLKNDEHSR